jgi:hypothetical protein
MAYRDRLKSVFFGLVITLLVVVLIVAVGTSGRSSDESCFVVDMLRAHVPGAVPEPYVAGAHEPVSFGTICVSTKQQLVKWRIDETFQNAYGRDRISDLRLCGPLNNGSLVVASAKKATDFAPVVLALGVGRRLGVRELVGSAVIDTPKMYDLLRAPGNYYISLYVYEKRSNQQVEVGRGKLRIPNKNARAKEPRKR